MRKAIFITTNDVELFDGDKVYSIESSLKDETIIARIVDSKYGHRPFQHWYATDKYFSTMEALKKYQIEHYQGLSINQVILALGLKRNDKRIKNLKEIIKYKLK